jgi:DNA-binding transcriptional ArsR family regulator
MTNRDAIDVARALADPIRLRILDRLIEGPASVAELVAETGATQPNVSNHLARLRTASLVRPHRHGRTSFYRLSGPHVAELVEALGTTSGLRSRPARTSSTVALARSCYDHAAGRLGVDILEALSQAGAVTRPRREGRIDLGPAAEEVFKRLGVDLAGAAERRRRFAFTCLDWTERRPHLGGALGAAILDRLLERNWVRRVPGSRALLPTSAGRRMLSRVLGLAVRGARVQ